MNTSIQTPYIRDKKQWYFLSLFYAREKWTELIAEIIRFYQERQGQFCNCLLSLSVEKGEHIQVTLVSSVDGNNYTDEVQSYFQIFFEQNPSISSTLFPYGKAVWGNYPNNSLIWNKFSLQDYSEQYINFHQQTIKLALKLSEDDFSEDTIFSVGMYLITKGLCFIAGEEQKNALSQALHDAFGAVGFTDEKSTDGKFVENLLRKRNLNMLKP